MKITPIKLAKALLQARSENDTFGSNREDLYNYDKFPHWKKLQVLEEIKIIIRALQIIKDKEKLLY